MTMHWNNLENSADDFVTKKKKNKKETKGNKRNKEPNFRKRSSSG